MDILNNDQKIAVMRVLLDIIYADGRVDIRETAYYSDLLNELHLSAEFEELIQKKSSLIALLDIKNFTLEQKEYFAAMMDKMIKVDQNGTTIQTQHLLQQTIQHNLGARID